MAAMAGKKLRVLCFGDSLTSGYASYGIISHPYEEKLAEALQKAIPGLEVDTTEDGRPGDITGFFANRIQEHFGPGKPKFDWTIILGGTNDLAYNYTPETVFENLQRCWDLALQSGSKVLALTVPEAGIKSRADAKRDKLNALIKAAAGGNLFVHDHHATVPFWSMSDDDRTLYWDDNIHLTSEGYDLMGEAIAARLVEIFEELDGTSSFSSNSEQKKKLKAASAETETETADSSTAGPTEETTKASSAAVPTRKQPSRMAKAFKDDEIVFEEEQGNPSKLTRGYVVVRKKDLD